MLIQLFIFVGAIFGFFAGLIAFGITYIEWQKHQFTGWDLWREPLRRACFAFLFFFFLSVALGFTLPLIVQH